MKSGIISLVIVNIICLAFMAFTCYARFGTDIDVVRDIDAVAFELGATSTKHRNKGMTFYSIKRKILMKTGEDFNNRTFWVDADVVFGTNDRDKLKELVDSKTHVNLNIFINPEDNEVIGVTTKGDSLAALFYANNKVVKYGLIILPAVDVFVILIMVLSNGASKRKAKKKQAAT